MWSEAFTWEGLSHVADALGVVTAVPFLVTSAYFVSRARRYRRRLRQLEGVTSGHPVALAVSLAGTRIRPAVETFCARFERPVRLVEIHRPGELSQSELPKVLLELQSLKNQLLDEGASEVHLFLSCPLAVACAVGALFDNWVPVKVYQFNQGQYEFWTTLHGGYLAELGQHPLIKVE
ncbi:MAG: SAVED domain-containing protein [Nitrospinae bacterium]|nr:SAVED domain-containing protein [Nitrospinota bacterium]